MQIPYVGGRMTDWPVRSFTGSGLTKQENVLLFVRTENTESKPVKQKTG